MKLGIVGSGKIVQEFLPWLASCRAFEVAALCSTQRSADKAAALCAQYGVPLHVTDYGQLLAAVDVVYIALPTTAAHLLRQGGAGGRPARHCGKAPGPLRRRGGGPGRSGPPEKACFLFEAVTTQYLENYRKLRQLLPRVGQVKLVQCNFSQYSSRYDGLYVYLLTAPVFDPQQAGGALMDLGVYNVSYIVGLFGEPQQVHYAANLERGIDTSGILTMDYRSFKAVSIAAKDCAAPPRYVIQGTRGYLLQKSTANFCGPGDPPPQRRPGRALLPERQAPPLRRRVRGDRPRHRHRRPGAVQRHAGDLAGRQPGPHRRAADRGDQIPLRQVNSTSRF